MRRTILFLALALACKGDSPAAPAVSVVGNWRGTTGSQVIDMALSEAGGAVTGSGTISNTPTGTRALTISGSFTGGPIGHVNVTMSSGSTQPFNFAGQVYQTSMLGQLTGSGFTGEVVTFDRR